MYTTHTIEEYIQHHLIFMELEQVIKLISKLCEIPIRKCQNLSPVELLAWIENLKGENQIQWKEFRSYGLEPSIFPYFVYCRIKDATIKSKKYPRLQNYESKCIALGDDLRNQVQNLDPVESAIFVGELAGAWVLSEPKAGIEDWESTFFNNFGGYEGPQKNASANEDGIISFMESLFPYSGEFSKYPKFVKQSK